MNEKAGGLSSMFNWKSLAWGLGMFLAGGMVDFILFHEHPLGQAMIELVKDPLLNFFDFFATRLDWLNLRVTRPF
ncbi:MAG: hypothetical protein LRZ85_04610 [Alphaproteobacteria bacterium]|nr:hypothetical protein [Alphaproteobacteria bacterium]